MRSATICSRVPLCAPSHAPLQQRSFVRRTRIPSFCSFSAGQGTLGSCLWGSRWSVSVSSSMYHASKEYSEGSRGCASLSSSGVHSASRFPSFWVMVEGRLEGIWRRASNKDVERSFVAAWSVVMCLREGSFERSVLCADDGILAEQDLCRFCLVLPMGFLWGFILGLFLLSSHGLEANVPYWAVHGSTRRRFVNRTVPYRSTVLYGRATSAGVRVTVTVRVRYRTRTVG